MRAQYAARCCGRPQDAAASSRTALPPAARLLVSTNTGCRENIPRNACSARTRSTACAQRNENVVNSLARAEGQQGGPPGCRRKGSCSTDPSGSGVRGGMAARGGRAREKLAQQRSAHARRWRSHARPRRSRPSWAAALPAVAAACCAAAVRRPCTGQAAARSNGLHARVDAAARVAPSGCRAAALHSGPSPFPLSHTQLNLFHHSRRLQMGVAQALLPGVCRGAAAHLLQAGPRREPLGGLPR